ncbi:MAG: N-6 DNA methylase [Sterolibacterium sp.]
MDKTSAQRIVRETFKAAFDRKRFRDFISELCNGFDESKAQNMLVPDAFMSHIKSCQRLGTFESADGELADVLIVHLTESFKLERTRTALRDFVAHKLKRGDSYKEAGLVAFVAPGSQSWRFSYVRMEYETRRDSSTGKIKSEERLTPARRYSYLVGEDEQCHTAQTRFLALLQNTSDKPTLAQIEEAFSVESVSKEFFKEYARLFETTEAALAALVKKDKTLRADFEAKHVNTADFTKKLLGQIVFLYFIQKKGWLGVTKDGNWGDGPRHFLRQLATQSIEKKQNLFNDVLEPLFYDTLATDRGHEAWCQTFQCRIPFLNGGLFEPLAGYDWENTEITLPNTLLTNRETNAAGDTGTGILDVFDRYNFTVIEDEPLEKEVAIDPEMLGKVFEQLIEENRRKGLGAFYTPREIVHYMCQESLINYLDTALNHPLKPIGMVAPQPETPPLFVDSDELPKAKTGQQEFLETSDRILAPRDELAEWIGQSDQFAHYAAAIEAGITKGDHYHKPPAAIRKYAREIDELLRDITVCDPAVGSGAFLVGMMNEIVRARMALTPYFNDVAERTAYHFKRRAIQNSLYGVDIDVGAVEIAKLRLWLSLVVDEEDVQQIKPLPNLDYKIVAGNSLLGVEKNLFNQSLFKRLEELKPKFFNESDRKKKAQFKKQIDDLIHELTNGREVFDYEIYFSEVFHAKQGFDVVIANPPYGAEFSDKDKDFLKRKFDHIVERIRNSFLYFLGQSFLISRNQGICCFIIPNEFLFQIYMTKARRFFLNESKYLFAINLGDEVFEAVVPTALLAFQKTCESSYDIPVADLRDCEPSALGQALSTKSFTLSSSSVIAGTPNAMFSFNVATSALVMKLATSYQKLETYCDDIANGISTSCDDIYIVSAATAQNEGLENVYLKPCIRGGQFNRYFCPEETGDFVLWVTDGFNKKLAPNIHTYLARNKELLIRKCVEKNSGTRPWHVLFRGRSPSLYASPKILVRQTGDRIIASADLSVGYFCIDSVNVVQLKQSAQSDIAYFVGLLNSIVAHFFYRAISQEKGRILAQVKPQRIKAIPVVMPDARSRSKVASKVQEIVSIKASSQNNPNEMDQAKIRRLEEEIDECFYKYYGLTPDEIALIEAAR